MTDPIHYLNTDLELTGPIDLGPLASALGAPERLNLLSMFQREDGNWFAGLETWTDDDAPEATICGLLGAIENLPPETQVAWNACHSRELNIGYACGAHPKEVSHSLSLDTVQRLVACGLGLRITLYPAPAPEAALENC